MPEASLVPVPSSSGPSPGWEDDEVNRESERHRFDQLVDAVVERIEQRVVDELERRGRRQNWSSF